MGLVYVVAIIAGLIVANIALAARSGRSPLALFIEALIYVASAGLATFVGVRTRTFQPALALLTIVLVAGLVSRLEVGKRVLRLLRLHDALNETALGRRFNARVDLAKLRMAERDRKARELGISVVDVLEIEHAEKHSKR